MNVSAICTTYNCRQGLEDCLYFLQKSVNNGELDEIIAVDGGSTDGTWETLQDMSHAIPELQIHHEKGANISRGRNCAIAMASGDIILCFDSGCVMSNDYVADMIRPLRDDTTCDVVGGNTIAVGESTFENIGAALTNGTQKYTFNPSSRSIAFRRHVFDTVGGYNENAPAGEDTDFNNRWRSAGFRFTYAKKAEIYWRVRPNLWAWYRMARRNATGSAILGNPRNLYGWGAITAPILPLIVVASIGVFAATQSVIALISGLVTGTLWITYFCARLLRRGRWKTFCVPSRFLYGMLILLIHDYGTVVGVLRGTLIKYTRRLAQMINVKKT